MQIFAKIDVYLNRLDLEYIFCWCYMYDHLLLVFYLEYKLSKLLTYYC